MQKHSNVNNKEIKSDVRNNKNIWKLAKYLFIEFTYSIYVVYGDGGVDYTWEDGMSAYEKNDYYDKAAKLLKRMNNGVFS